MKVIGINGSPRRRRNSATVLDKALEGAASVGGDVKRIDLFDLNFRGCMSCFACKRLDGPSYSRCAQRDALTPVLDKILISDVLIVSVPIYYGEVPGAVRSFYERLLYPPNHYTGSAPDEGYGFRMPVGLIYTMGVKDPAINGDTITKDAAKFQRFLGDTETLNIVDCWQFDDYTKYACSGHDVEEKRRHREVEFPKELEAAFEMGKRLALAVEKK